MEEELEFVFDSAEEGMSKAIERLEHEMARIRAGKASPMMLNSVQVEDKGLRPEDYTVTKNKKVYLV